MKKYFVIGFSITLLGVAAFLFISKIPPETTYANEKKRSNEYVSIFSDISSELQKKFSSSGTTSYLKFMETAKTSPEWKELEEEIIRRRGKDASLSEYVEEWEKIMEGNVKRAKKNSVPSILLETDKMIMALRIYKEEFDTYPSGDNREITAAIMAGKNPSGMLILTGVDITNRYGEATDPWETPFRINIKNEKIEIRSAGPNRVFNDEDDYEKSWPKEKN